MFSLRVAIILALSTRFDSYAIFGYTVDIPFTVENPIVETNIVFEATTPCPETINDSVIETPTVPTLDFGDQSNAVATGQFTVLQQNFNISGHARKGKKKSCVCKECNPENGFFIKHFRQYNYYYPHGHKVSLPMQNPYAFSNEEPSDDIPVGSSISMINNNSGMGVKRSSKSTVRYNSPGVASYVPNNDFNYVYNQPGSGYPVNGRTPLLDQSSINIEEPVSSNESAEQTAELPSDDETAPTGNPSDDNNINEDIINYFSEPNVFGHTRRTVVKNGNSHFRSQQVSISSRTQTQSQPLPGIGPQEEDGITSIMESQSMPDSESEEQDRISSSMQSQSMPGSESQQQDQISSSMQSQSLSGYGSQQQNGISSMMQSQSLSGSDLQQQDQTSSSMQSQFLSGYGSQQQNGESSIMQSQSLSGSEPQQQVQTSSSMQSQRLSGYGPSINLANENSNFGGQNVMTVGYNPYFQPQTFDLSPMLQPQPLLPMLGFQNNINWLRGSTANSQINQRKTSQYLNPIRTWQNTPLGPFDLTNVEPSYSVII